ncbi:hypothetical protein ACI7YT_12590 [Microbacterium sp. M]|uniref:hypothetical protein n=1 Tax=Microbacterium sp. M TaxID=3377125 RepID=UPI0038667AD4
MEILGFLFLAGAVLGLIALPFMFAKKGSNDERRLEGMRQAAGVDGGAADLMPKDGWDRKVWEKHYGLAPAARAGVSELERDQEIARLRQRDGV